MLPICLVFAMAACGDPFVPSEDMPEGAVWTAPTPLMVEEYQRAEECSGRNGDVSRVQWYIVPGVEAFTLPGDRQKRTFYGITYFTRHIIILAGNYVNSRELLRHESLHDILQVQGHPEVPFAVPCNVLHDGAPG